MSKRILFVLTPSFDPNAGGVQRTTYKLGRYFTDMGYDIAYFSFAHDGHVKSEYGELHHSLEKGRAGNNSNLDAMEKVCERFAPDFVVNQMPYEYPITERLGNIKEKYNFLLLGCLRNSLFSVVNNLGAAMKTMLPGPLFPLFNNGIGRKVALERHKYLHRKSLKHILSNHDRYILLSPPNNKELKYFVGDFMQDKVLAIPNSIPEVQAEPGEKEKIILHVGRLNDDQKRSDLLLPFWKTCKDQLPDWQFIIVGDGPYKKKIEEQVKKQNIDRVTLTGFQEPEAYYKKSSIFMMPSAYEGFPNTILEAHSYGCPVIAYKSYDALEWIVNDGKDAILIKPYDFHEMGQKIEMLANKPLQLKEFQKAALQNADRFTIDKVGETWENLFSELLKQELTIERT